MIVTKVRSILFYSVLIMPALSIQSSVAELKSMFPQYSEDFLVNIIQQERTLYHFTCDWQTDVSFLLAYDETPNPYPYFLDAAMTVRINPIVSGNREIEEIEERYKLNLHKQWKVRLPDDLLVVCLSVDCYSSFIFLPVSMMMKNMLEWVRSFSIDL